MLRLAVVLAAVGCGRIAFSPATDDDAAVAPDAPFVPGAGTCVEAEGGPFREIARFPTAGGGYGVWAAPPYVLAADTTGGLTSLRFEGGGFAQAGHLDGLGWVEAVWSEGSHYYVGAPGTGLAVVELSASGGLSLRTQNTAIVEARRGSGSEGTVFVPNGGAGLYAARFDGTTLVPVGTPTPSMSWAQGAWASGNRVILADNAFVRVLDFDGSAFTDVISPDNRWPGATRVWSDGTVIFIAHGSGVTAYRLEGTSLVDVATFTTNDSARDVWSDGHHVFVAAESDGVYALDFRNDQFVELDQIAFGSQALGVMGDGQYIYANDLSGGIRAYAGFACLRW